MKPMRIKDLANATGRAGSLEPGPAVEGLPADNGYWYSRKPDDPVYVLVGDELIPVVAVHNSDGILPAGHKVKGMVLVAGGRRLKKNPKGAKK